MRGAGGEVSNVRYTDIQMKHVGYAISLYSDYVDGNRPNFKGDARLVPSFHDILIDHVKVESARNAGRIVGLPENHIRGVTLDHVEVTAGTNFVVKDAEPPTFEHVLLTIRKDIEAKMN